MDRKGDNNKRWNFLIPRTWKENTTRTCPNMKVHLSDEVKNNIKEYVKHSGYNPDYLIEFLRRGFDSTENTPKWECKTVGEEIEFLSNDWFKTNIWYPNKEWYDINLK